MTTTRTLTRPCLSTLAVVAAVVTMAFASMPGSLDAGAQETAPDAERTLLERDVPEIGPVEATNLFREANALYADGDYGPAAEVYEVILAGGFRNADVYYNLANARYKSGELGQAVLGYERALRLEPGHEDAWANLEFVRSQLADRQAPVGGPLSQAADRFFTGGAPNGLAVAASALYFFALALVVFGVLRRFFPPWLTRTVIVVAVVLVAAVGTLGFRVGRAGRVREAVIVALDVSVRTGPGNDFVLEFRLHEGTKVRVREARESWTRVSVEGTDLEGWLPEEAIEEI
jgi:hypothetical protein